MLQPDALGMLRHFLVLLQVLLGDGKQETIYVLFHRSLLLSVLFCLLPGRPQAALAAVRIRDRQVSLYRDLSGFQIGDCDILAGGLRQRAGVCLAT
ncbi:hypothetical protein D3C72_1891340 [compost metagenome]